jgi:hypothetical protein
MAQVLNFGHGWYVVPQDDGTAHVVCAFGADMEKGGGIIVARVSGGDGQYHLDAERTLATAHLISAATDMLAALTAAEQFVEFAWFRACDNDRGEDAALKGIRAAIAKASGR